MKLTLPKWYDLHVHFRQGPAMQNYIQAHIDMGCAGVLAMPNTKPPVAKVLEDDDLDVWSIESYLDQIRQNGGQAFGDVIVPLYLTAQTTPDMIAGGAQEGFLRACKYYPPHGTTGAEYGVPLAVYAENGVLKAMEDNGVVLCVHGEQHGLPAEHFFDKHINAEEIFYSDVLPKIAVQFPDIKIVGEHVTTKKAVEFVTNAGPNVAATITPQHLLYTVGHLLQGLKYHLYCLPLLKYEEDRKALRDAVTNPDNSKFFAGTDSAPHTTKAIECGCAAGCFTGGIAPQLYAQAFEEAGLDFGQDKNHDIFKRFLCTNGLDFYGLKYAQETFTMIKETQKVDILRTPEGPITPLTVGLGETEISWKIDV